MKKLILFITTFLTLLPFPVAVEYGVIWFAFAHLSCEVFCNQEKLTLTYDLKQAMRYGENPQQDADFYQKY